MWTRIKTFVRDAKFSWLDFAIMLGISLTLMIVTHTITN